MRCCKTGSGELTTEHRKDYVFVDVEEDMTTAMSIISPSDRDEHRYISL